MIRAISVVMNILQAILIFCLCIVPQSPVPCDRVSTLELNNFYDGEGKLIFIQLIGWTENDTVRFWRMAKGDQYIPKRDWGNGGYCVTFADGDELRTVVSNSFRETWSQDDPELANRVILPAEKRKPLRHGGGKGRN